MVNENDKLNNTQSENQACENKDDIFQVEEITIEEMAIDGICGVY
jgi:mycofactocin precursor